jgi:hypothetical protein
MERRRLEPPRAVAALGLAVALAACASGPVAPGAGAGDAALAGAPPAAAADLDARILALEQAIARDEEAVRALLAQPAGNGPDPLLDSAELRAIAARLPAQQAELARLREERERAGRP